MKAPKISIITPTLNQGDFIEETIQSVLQQDHSDIEYIIVDGGSTDRTPEIVSKYKEYISLFISEKDSGQSEAINKGIRASSGDIIGWLNSDDVYLPGALRSVAEHYSVSKSAYIGKIITFRPGYEHPQKKSIIYQSPGKSAGMGGMTQPAMFFSRRAYGKLGLLNEKLHYCMDLEWWLKYLFTFGVDEVVSINEYLAKFRLHEMSKTIHAESRFVDERNSIFSSIAEVAGLKEIASMIREKDSVSSELCQFEFSFDEKSASVARMAVHYHLLQRGDECYAAGKRSLASDYFSLIDTSLLTEPDKRYVRSLRLKNRIIPTFLKRSRK